MLTEWIKLEKSTSDKPEVLQIARNLNITPEQVVGHLIRIWTWADDHLTDANAAHLTSSQLDVIAHRAEFAHELLKVGWLSELNGLLIFTNFVKHNGQTAKTRAQTAKRVATHTANGKLTPLTLTEKKRKEVPPLPPKGGVEQLAQRRHELPPESNQFVGFWDSYPRAGRVNRGRCWRAWNAAVLDKLVTEIVHHVEAMKRSRQWTENGGQYVPLALTYLNQKRWEAGSPTQAQKEFPL